MKQGWCVSEGFTLGAAVHKDDKTAAATGRNQAAAYNILLFIEIQSQKNQMKEWRKKFLLFAQLPPQLRKPEEDPLRCGIGPG